MTDEAWPEPGSRWRLTERVGLTAAEAMADAEPDEDGNLPPFTVAPIPEGTEVEVREIVPADVQGAHTADEDAVVIEFDDLVIHEGTDGVKEVGTTRRAWSCSLPDFERLFEQVT